LKAGIAAAVAAGLPLSGWLIGGGALEGIAASPVRALAILCLVFASVGGALAMARLENVTSRGTALQARQSRVISLGWAVSSALTFAGPATDSAGLSLGPEALRWVGLALLLAGSCLMLWAPLHLGRYFSWHLTLQQDHVLVTDGPYALVRHPRYAGIMAWGVGLGLVFNSVVGLALGLVLAGLMHWRLREEESFMASQFGAQWQAYAARTYRLLPGVY